MATNDVFPIRLWLAVGVVLATLALPESSARGDDVEDWIRILEASGKPTLRVQTLKDLRTIAEQPRSAAAIPVLTTLLKDADAKVRAEAVTTLGELLYFQKRPCPLELVRMLDDSDAEVRFAATSSVDVFDKYPDGALPLFKRWAGHADVRVRRVASRLLRVAGTKDPEALRLVDGLTRDSDPLVWNNAEVAYWQMTHNVERFVLHCLKLIDRDRPLDEDATEAEKQVEGLRKQMAALAWTRLKEQLAREPEATSQGLLKACRHDAVEIRRTAPRALRGLAKENADVRNRLRSEGAEGVLQDLAEDSDEQARREAAAALQSLQEN